MTTREKTDAASPLEKFEILASEIDKLRQSFAVLEQQRSVDDLIELVPLSELSTCYGVPLAGLRKKISDAGGEVFKIGRHSFIRKIKLLTTLESLEQECPSISPSQN